MNNFYAFSDREKRMVLEQTAIKQGLPKQIIEKDLWVSTLLEIVFTLPFSDKLVFKGGTSLSKVWGLISRFSEDIDIAIDRSLFGLEGDLTIRQIKKLRRDSSLFVNNDFCIALRDAIAKYGLDSYLVIEPQPNGEGDKTYPEPRQILVKYKSMFELELSYIKPHIILEIGSRSLFEPTEKSFIKSMISAVYPAVKTSVVKQAITTSVAQKTFLEKAFLLHELFTTEACSRADRKSRHLYDLEHMMDKDFAIEAIKDDNLWLTIHHHREVFTRMRDVDYSEDIRKRIVLTPPEKYYQLWALDYANMQSSMIYDKSISFEELMERMRELENRFKKRI